MTDQDNTPVKRLKGLQLSDMGQKLTTTAPSESPQQGAWNYVFYPENSRSDQRMTTSTQCNPCSPGSLQSTTINPQGNQGYDEDDGGSPQPLNQSDAVPVRGTEDACAEPAKHVPYGDWYEESYTGADICMLHTEEDERAVEKLKYLLTHFIDLDDGAGTRKLIFFPALKFGENQFEWIEMALQGSQFRFLYIGTNTDCELEKYKLHMALLNKLKHRDRSIVPVKVHHSSEVPVLVAIFRPLIVSQILRGRTLDDIDDVTRLTKNDVDDFFLQGVKNMFQQHPSSKRKMVPQLRQSKGAKVFQTMYADLTNKMDPDNGLLGRLFSLEVISRRDMADIEAEKTFFAKNECLLKKLIDQNICQNKFEKFVQALDSTNQTHISSQLLKTITELSGVR